MFLTEFVRSSGAGKTVLQWLRCPMRSYAVFLRGVSPTTVKMPELKRCLEFAGFKDVKTFLSSGNVSFGVRAAPEASLERKIEAAMTESLGRIFLPIVRSIDALQALLASDPFESFQLAPNSKRVVTFLREPPKSRTALPPESDGARILGVSNTQVFSAYVPGPNGPVFMSLIEKTFGKQLTTRTWDTVRKVAGGATAEAR